MKLLEYPDSDALVVELSDAKYDHSEVLDEDRVIRYAANGEPIAVEFLGVSNGVNLDGVPKKRTVREFLAACHVVIASHPCSAK